MAFLLPLPLSSRTHLSELLTHFSHPLFVCKPLAAVLTRLEYTDSIHSLSILTKQQIK